MASLFLEQYRKRVLFFDGAMGTSIHKIDLDLEADYLGKENCTEVLLLTRPEVIQGIHEEFLAAGADAVETDSFNSSIHTMEDQDLQDRVYELNVLAAKTARAACDNYSTEDKPRFVVGSMGPGTKLITLGNIDWDTMYTSYCEQVRGLIDGGVDVFLIETCQDILQVKCVINATIDTLAEKGKSVEDIPIMVQVTIETMGTMLVGTDIAGVVNALEPYPILSVGMNCATGPAEMAEYVNYLGKHWAGGISLLPNAGLPALVDGEAVFPLGPEPFAEAVAKYVQTAGLNIVGGCCGTTPEHIAALVKAVGVQAPVKVEKEILAPGCSSLYGPTEYRQDASILNVGERTNASGSRAFKRLLEAEDWDGIVSLARNQVKEGSHVIDLNVDYAGRDNAKDMAHLVSLFVGQVDVPLMLDSTQAANIEAGLKCAGGKCLINSSNLEDGEEKFAHFCQLAKRYGAALVLGCIDEDPEDAMARTETRKIEIAHRMYDLAVNKYGVPPEDIIFDPLVLPISTGMDQDRESGLATIAGVKRITEELPLAQTTVGLSNISFGLKPAARQVLNSVFLFELKEAGLTSAILHATKILPRPKISDEHWTLALDLIYNRAPSEPVKLADGSESSDPLQLFINAFSDSDGEIVVKEDIASLPLEERLQKHIIEGEKQNLVETLEEARAKYEPVEIINDHLLEGMKVVGELFGSGQMQLPFVLQSAEVMKMAVGHLEQYMDKVAGESRGKLVLATVRGDVHDIGKNLVDIILSNNGYEVVNLGIKIPVGDIVSAYKEHKADAVGMSGLLVKSVNVMEENLNELNSLDIDVPLLLGGAALSRHYCDSRLRDIYGGDVHHGKDAFEGLRVMNAIMDGESDELNRAIDERLEKRAAVEAKVQKDTEAKAEAGGAVAVAEPVKIADDNAIPAPPFWGDRVVESESIPLSEVYAYVNKIALYRGQWQFKKGRKTDEEYAEQIKHEIDPIFKRLTEQCVNENILRPRVVYGYWPCNSDGDDLIVYDAVDHDKEVERFTFPRQAKRQRLCLSDFFRSVESGERDVIGMSCVTVGDEVSKITKTLFENDDYAEYLYLHGLGVESAEGLAEMWHKRIRQELGFSNEDSPKMRDLFTQKYRGSRYSFGYPACPEMSDQDKLFRLLKPERIGCNLTENWQIDPEQSTSALIVHHPEAKYFNV